MNGGANLALAGLVVGLACSQGCQRASTAPLALVAGDGGRVTFPPEETWTERAPLERTTRVTDADDPDALRVVYPSLDASKHFEFQGRTLRIELDEDAIAWPPSMSDTASTHGRARRGPLALPRVRVTPSVAGRTVWTQSNVVELRAEKPFDPEVRYRVELPEITAPNGKKLVGGFDATFNATPVVEVGGKTIYYLPKPGRARVVAMVPADGAIGPRQDITVVYDQPVDLELARKLITLGRAQNRVASSTADARSSSDGPAAEVVDVPMIVRHPSSSSFEGQNIDARTILSIRPTRPLEPGDELRATAKNQGDDGDDGHAIVQRYRISERTKLTSIACNGRACNVDGSIVRGDTDTSVRVRFSNPLQNDLADARKHVHITPNPKNLWIYGQNELQISASFLPSTTYAIRIEGARDRYGELVPPVDVRLETRALPASATMSEGVILLDDAGARRYAVTTRNVRKADLQLWSLPKGDAAAFMKALTEMDAGTTPPGEPVIVPIAPARKRDAFVETKIDLHSELEPQRSYVARLVVAEPDADALAVSYDSATQASRPPMAMLHAAGPNALAAHAHRVFDKAAVQVFRLATGEPVAGARVEIGTERSTTDAAGTCAIRGLDPRAPAPVVRVTADGTELMMPLERDSLGASELFPELTTSEEPALALDAAGYLVTDRGVYRPGSTMHVKAFARHVQDTHMRVSANEKVRLRVDDPMGESVLDEVLTTNQRGYVTKDVAFPASSHTGRFAVRLEKDDANHSVLATETVRVADFRAPTFKVDVEREASPGAPSSPPGSRASPPQRLKARITGRHLFGAPLAGGRVTWILKKSLTPVRGGALADAGLRFDAAERWWTSDDAAKSEAARPLTGEGTLDANGVLSVDVGVDVLPGGPTELLLEADVEDPSGRHVSGQLRATVDDAPGHAGVDLGGRFGSPGRSFEVRLGVVDGTGNAIFGAPVSARLEHITWTRTRVRAESGAFVERWHEVATRVAGCSATSGAAPVSCALRAPREGSYRVVSAAFGRDGGSASFWAYATDAAAESGARWEVPSAGKRIPLALDKSTYRAGQTAKLLVQSPFAKATALVTLEQGGLLRHETHRIDGPSKAIDVPLTLAHAPWVHAAVTLLPIGASEADYRIGVARIPVSADAASLDVRVTSAKKVYDAGAEAEITVQVTRDGAKLADADVALGVVDEGVLRLTAYHPKDPVAALRPGRPLDFRLTDSRAALVSRRDRAHVAGGGDSEAEESIDTRKRFVETAAWLPDLVTDAEGLARVKVKLPDNLTELRMTAVVLDAEGRGGVAESSFQVTRVFHIDPVLPRFAVRGDRFEAAAMVHNESDTAQNARVAIADQTRDLRLPAHGQMRVAVPMTADQAGPRRVGFALEIEGSVKDRAEIELRVDEPGLEEHPMSSGAFARRQEIALSIPADAVFTDDAYLSVKTGSGLYPELGQRLAYLLEYPHGCVEQTTSSTIPLVAARTLLPWTGTTPIADEELRRRIDAGVARLATMQTPSGGLAYWPGGREPHVYGSAYAMRVLLRARDIGITRPGLVERLTQYLQGVLMTERSLDLRMSIAEVLAEAKALPVSAADTLFDGRGELDASGLASLALALSSLPKQLDRVREVLDRLESAFDGDGAPKKAHDARDAHYWGSDDRDRAQTTIALARLRPSSRALPNLASRLSRGLTQYSTQTTAWSLLALSDFVGARAASGGVDVQAELDGKRIDSFVRLGGNNKDVRIPLKELAGKNRVLILHGEAGVASAYAIEARYTRPLDAAGSRVGRRAAHGVSIHRVYTDAAGARVDLANVKLGQIVRVAIRAEMPSIEAHRRGYAALTDRLPAGFEPIDPDLSTTGAAPGLSRKHPFYEDLAVYTSSASHVDLRDDRVNVYFDRVDQPAVHATYLARAATAGTFGVAPARGELMYERRSEGYSDATSVTIR